MTPRRIFSTLAATALAAGGMSACVSINHPPEYTREEPIPTGIIPGTVPGGMTAPGSVIDRNTAVRLPLPPSATPASGPRR